jgi:hypothetical protein
MGNMTFFQRPDPSGAGFQSFKEVFIKILREDIPAAALAKGANFHRGQSVTLTDGDDDAPGSGDTFDLIYAEDNSSQPMLIILHLEKLLA